MKYARVVAGTAVDVRTVSPEGFYHPDIAAGFVEVPLEVEDGWTVDAGVWTAPVIHTPPVTTPTPPTVSVITYKMLFTSDERIAAKASDDPVVVDLQDLLNDPHTTQVDLSLKSISDALDYMTAIGMLADGRKAEILTGKIQ